MISPFRFFEIYTAVVLHFTTDRYDFFQFGGKTRVNENSLLKRKDKYFFEKMANKCSNEEMAIGVCVANTIIDKSYVRNFDMNEYIKWTGYRDALEYNFNSELNKYISRKHQAFGLVNYDPLNTLVEMVISKEVSKEFMILFNLIMAGEIYRRLDSKENFLWEDVKKSLVKYEPFIKSLWNITPETIHKLQKSVKAS